MSPAALLPATPTIQPWLGGSGGGKTGKWPSWGAFCSVTCSQPGKAGSGVGPHVSQRHFDKAHSACAAQKLKNWGFPEKPAGSRCTVLPPDLGPVPWQAPPCDTPASVQPERCGRSLDYRVRQTGSRSWRARLTALSCVLTSRSLSFPILRRLMVLSQSSGEEECMAWRPRSPSSPGHLGAPRSLRKRPESLLRRCCLKAPSAHQSGHACAKRAARDCLRKGDGMVARGLRPPSVSRQSALVAHFAGALGKGDP